MFDARVAKLADELIPAGVGLPAAAEADPEGKWLARALAARCTAHLIATAGLQPVPA
ncbi:MAG TPA: hypothetical protein VNB65_05835 [Gaiellaceae bacterium]|jgi:hypothetical protein|nr:hypothetical protein [Gaiellaceae bacterium]